MKPGSYPYPSDEFDAAARAGGPRGVHRAPRSRWSRWWPFLLVLVVFPALAYGSVLLVEEWDNLFGSDSGQEGPTALEDVPSDEPTQEEAEETPEPTPTEEETPEPPPAPPLDQARHVDVYNATNRSGLAGNAAGRLEGAGFSSVSALNWRGADPAASVVYYPTADDVTTAQAVAAALGITQVVESLADAPDSIVVVLWSDYQTG